MKRNNFLRGVAGGLTLLLAGCPDEEPSKPYHREEYTQVATLVEKEEMPEFLKIEGRVIQVQPGSVSYCGDNDGRPDGSRISANHEFEYIVLETRGSLGELSGNQHVFIYPFTRAVTVGKEVTLKFRPISGGRTNSNDFVKTFLSPNWFADDSVPLVAEGYIAADGISYK